MRDAVWGILYDAGNAEFTSVAVTVLRADAAFVRCLWYGLKLCVQSVTVGPGQLLGLTLAAELTVAEELAVGLAVAVSSDDPSMS